MVPNVFMFLNAFPLLPNGKINRKALPEPVLDREELGTQYISPRDEKERILAEIWQSLLNVARVGVKDNFFELGGDSILSIQAVARANQAGLKITPKQLFEYPTIEGLAGVAKEGVAIHAEQEPVTGEVPLTPIQRRFFDLNLKNPAHWNQSLAVELNGDLDEEAFRRALAEVINHHDMLRARFDRAAATGAAEIAEEIENIPFSVHDLRKLKSEELPQALERIGQELQGSFDLATPPLMRAGYILTPEGNADILKIVLHHLVVDGVSWRILLEDILLTYRQALEGKAVKLPPKTTPFKYWAEKLREYARSDRLAGEIDYWESLNALRAPDLPVDFPDGENTEQSAKAVSVFLTEEETRALIKEAPSAYQTQVNELLLSALLTAYNRWSGFSRLIIDLEGHGREDLFEDVDISRTVGWFTVSYPLALNYNGAWSKGDIIKQVKETYRNIPNHGIGFGVLRYLSPDEIAAKLAQIPEPAIGFNYLGQFDQISSDGQILGKPRPPLGRERDPEGRRVHLLEIGGNVRDNRLTMTFSYSENLFKEETVRNFARIYLEELKAVIEHCLSTEAGGYTPSDFRDVDLDQEDLEDLLDELDL